MKYDDDTICRLNEAAEKWTAYSRGDKSMRVGTIRDCPLCSKFRQGKIIHLRCCGCPIRDKTGEVNCRNTPYQEWAEFLAGIEAAKEEAVFLQELLFKVINMKG